MRRLRHTWVCLALLTVGAFAATPSNALPTIHEVARWHLWPNAGSFLTTMATSDTEIFLARVPTFQLGASSYSINRCSRTTGAIQASFPVQKDTTDLWAGGVAPYFGMKGDTVVTGINWTTVHGALPHGIVRLYTRGGAPVAQWPEKHFPYFIRSVLYSGGHIWILHNSGYADDSITTVPAGLIRYDLDGTHPIEMFPSSTGNPPSPNNMAADVGGGVVAIYNTGPTDWQLLRYSATGKVLAQRTLGFVDDIWEDHLGNVFVHDPEQRQLIVMNLRFQERGRIAGEDAALGPLDFGVIGDKYCRLYSHRLNEGSGDSLWVLTADPYDGMSGDCWKPVLLVHGICGDSTGWDPFAQVLADSGFAVERVQYGSTAFNDRPEAYVGVLAAKLDLMGSDTTAVVGHSMGGLIAREYVRKRLSLGRRNRISQLVTLGTPNHGADMIAKVFSWGPLVDRLIGPIFGTCQSAQRTRPALRDMVPGSPFLNRLNYGTANTESPAGHGWDSHPSETALPSTVYLASVGGTGTFCNKQVREILWGRDNATHPNDCTVATGGALFANDATFRAADPLLSLDKPAAHTGTLTTPCGEPYYRSTSLAERVVRILRTSPEAPPVGLVANNSSLPALLAAPEDSLQMLPAIGDSIPSGQRDSATVVIPATTLATFLLLSADAHLSLVDPNGTTITVNDTSAAVSFAATDDPGCEGFELTAPLAGTWKLRFDASNSSEGQRIAAIVHCATTATVELSTLLPQVLPGDPIHVRGQMAEAGTRRTDVSWTCSVLAPDGASSALALYDDGAHGDSLSGDGIYGNSFAPAGGVGLYQLSAVGTAPGLGPLESEAYCELADVQDLAIAASDIELSRNVANLGDTVLVSATVHNNSSTAASGVAVEFRDEPADILLGTSVVNIAANGTAVAQISWAPASPDSHTIEVEVSPYVLDESNYANNLASIVVVPGQPVSVGPQPAASRLRFNPPYPNPTSSGVVFNFSVPERAVGSLVVFDVLGRRVRSWRWSSLLPGAHSVVWDARSASGVRLAAGVYFCRLEVGGETLQRKVVLQH